MSSQYFPKSRSYSRYGVLSTQRRLLAACFPDLHCQIVNNVLVLTGWLQPDDCAGRYRVRIEYVAGREPNATILSPVISPSPKIHMYNDHSLCLSFRPDLRWTERTPVYQYTIPWVAEWILYYEMYLLNGGTWEGPESPFHLREQDKNLNVDTS
jgi:hypothetical protein